MYPYRSIKSSLQVLAARPGFLQKCELWRNHPSYRQTPLLGDIYGEVWKSFNSSLEFLNSPFCTLNVDWFQPFERDVYSVGAIYLTIQNLPRKIRHKPEIPASRKVSGFLGHTASLGCNKCLKRFPVNFGQSSDFSGYDRENWTQRTAQRQQE